MIKYNQLKKKLTIKESQVYDSPLELSDDLIVQYVNEYHNIDKITSTLIEDYKNEITNEIFSVDPVIQEFKVVDSLGKINYTLMDGSKIAIDESTNKILVDVLNKLDEEIVEFMKQSEENFMKIIKEI